MSDLIDRHQAIDALKTVVGVGNRALDKLRQLPSAHLPDIHVGDMISRAEAIKVASGYCHPANIADELRKLPSAQPMRWIPCSKRLPEDLEEVNVTWVNHDPEPYYNFFKDIPFTATAVYYKEKWYWYSSTCADLLAEYGRNPNQEIDDGIEITAWMPLPEPWKGEQDV